MTKEHGLIHQPKVVIWGFFAGNDAVATPHKLSLTSLAQRFIPTPITPLHLVIIFAGGFVAGILFLLGLRLLVRRVFYRSRGT